MEINNTNSWVRIYWKDYGNLTQINQPINHFLNYESDKNQLQSLE